MKAKVRKIVDDKHLKKFKEILLDKAEKALTLKLTRRRLKQVAHVQGVINSKKKCYHTKNDVIEKDIESCMTYYACRMLLLD